MKHALVWAAIIGLALYVRFAHFGAVPPSLYWEEVALGYDAYSLLETGKDHHGNPWPLVALESFGDWKPVGYAYALLPSIAAFGLTEFAVRLPSMVAGIAIVVGCVLLARQFSTSGWVAGFVAALSPWAIIFSRAAWESNLATAFLLWGMIALLHSLWGKHAARTSPKVTLLILAIISMSASMYTYHAHRLVAPLLLAYVFVSWIVSHQQASLKHGLAFVKKLMLPGVIFLVAVAPILLATFSDTVSHRFKTTSIFSDISIIETSNELKDIAGNTLVSRVVYHRYVLFSKEVLNNAIMHVSPEFLFVHGDNNPRHSIQSMGQLYHIEIFFVLLGCMWFYQSFSIKKSILLFWICIGVIPASLTTVAPHSLRTLVVLPVFIVLIAAGVSLLFEVVQSLAAKWSGYSRQIVVGAVFFVIAVYSMQFVLFWQSYTRVYPEQYATEWQYGYKEMVAEVAALQARYPETPTYISRAAGRPAMYYWFYTQTPPELVQASADTARKDQSEFLEYQTVTFFNTATELPTSSHILAEYTDKTWSVSLQ